jgi:NADH-quinone oxidoreductase subunit C
VSRVFAEDDEFPSVDSITSVWKSVNWFEREAFDLCLASLSSAMMICVASLLIMGSFGHPFRKDFPISGYVEMRYDPDQGGLFINR